MFLTLALVWSQLGSPQLVQKPLHSCDRFIGEATASLKQSQLDRRAAQTQVDQAQLRRQQIAPLVEQGAVARASLDKITQELEQRQAALKQAIDTEQKALNQVRSLRKMSVCAAPSQAYGKIKG